MDVKQLEREIVMTPFLEEVVERAKLYLKARIPIHLTGPAGTGKTTLAVKLAQNWGAPYYLIQGDETFNRQDLVGGLFGYSQKIIEDNFIPTVSKYEQKLTPIWVDNPVAIACRNGGTLIYDEFTRARPETNNVLLGILAENILLTSDRDGKMEVENVHPEFSIILTSNPQEYVGVNKAQNALLDRMITINLTGFDEVTEAAVTAKKSNLHYEQALKIVRFTRKVASQIQTQHSSVRSSIFLGKIYATCIKNGNYLELFFQCSRDVFGEDRVNLQVMKDVWNDLSV